MDRDKPQSHRTTAGDARAQERALRQAKALRENLLRRKGQGRTRAEQASEDELPAAPPTPADKP